MPEIEIPTSTANPANTSATGGPLSPAASPAPLEGKALLRFVQQWIVGITGLDGDMVRPRWQPEPPVIPDAGEAWASVGIGTRLADTFPQIVHDGAADGGKGADKMQRQEALDVLASFYDLGAGGEADLYASLLRDGMVIAQNREYLLKGGFDLAFSGDLIPAPVIIKTRWLYRVDLPFRLRRQINRTYPVQNLISAAGTIKALDGNRPVDTVFAVDPPTS